MLFFKLGDVRAVLDHHPAVEAARVIGYHLAVDELLNDADNVAARRARRGDHLERGRVPDSVSQGLALLAGAALVALLASALGDDAK